jgi:hypothetical protein
MSGQNRESQNARKPPPAPSFLAKSNTCSGQISASNQALQNSSRATKKLSSANAWDNTHSSGERYPTTTTPEGDEIPGFSFPSDRNDPEQRRLNLIEIEGLFAR